jgi:hypothetical protein
LSAAKDLLLVLTHTLSSLSGAKDLLLASVGMIASTSEQQVLPVGQDDKIVEGAHP